MSVVFLHDIVSEYIFFHFAWQRTTWHEPTRERAARMTHARAYHTTFPSRRMTCWDEVRWKHTFEATLRRAEHRWASRQRLRDHFCALHLRPRTPSLAAGWLITHRHRACSRCVLCSGRQQYHSKPCSFGCKQRAPRSRGAVTIFPAIIGTRKGQQRN